MDNLNDQIIAFLKNPSDLRDGLKNALQCVLADFQCDTGTIHLLDAEKRLLHLAVQLGLPPQMLEIVKTIPAGKGIAGQTVAQNKPVTICNLQTDTSGLAKPGAKQTGVGGALSVPMHDGGQIVGTLGIGTMRPHEFTPDEIRRLEQIADSIGMLVGMQKEE